MVKDFKLRNIKARQIFDSRGNPTIEVTAFTKTAKAKAMVPSGASTGSKEAFELRDNNSKLFFGKSVFKAVKNAESLGKKLYGTDVRQQRKIDEFMIKEDGTNNKSRYGANAILGISLAVSRLAAILKNEPYYIYLSKLSGTKLKYPVPHANIINGGKHSGAGLKIQEFMVVPKASSFTASARIVVEVYHELKSIILKKYGRHAINVGDEGGFAPPLEKAEDALNLIVRAIKKAGYEKKAFIAIDSAASEFYKNGRYDINGGLSGEQLQKYYKKLLKRFPIILWEDPFDENDIESFTEFTKTVKIPVMGDDLLCSNKKIIEKAIEGKWCNALLLKVNQIGTLTEAIESAKLAMEHKWKVMVSHRSGETEDTFIADFSFALGCGAIKLGAPCRSERTAKYNRLMEIEEEIRTSH